jgi:hypothetical protein
LVFTFAPAGVVDPKNSAAVSMQPRFWIVETQQECDSVLHLSATTVKRKRVSCVEGVRLTNSDPFHCSLAAVVLCSPSLHTQNSMHRPFCFEIAWPIWKSLVNL